MQQLKIYIIDEIQVLVRPYFRLGLIFRLHKRFEKIFTNLCLHYSLLIIYFLIVILLFLVAMYE